MFYIIPCPCYITLKTYIRKLELLGYWESKPLFYKLENHYQTYISETSVIKNTCHKIHDRCTNIITCFLCLFTAHNLLFLFPSAQQDAWLYAEDNGRSLHCSSSQCAWQGQPEILAWMESKKSMESIFLSKYALAAPLQSGMAATLISCEKKISLWGFRQTLGKEIDLKGMFCISGERGVRGGQGSRACE